MKLTFLSSSFLPTEVGSSSVHVETQEGLCQRLCFQRQWSQRAEPRPPTTQCWSRNASFELPLGASRERLESSADLRLSARPWVEVVMSLGRRRPAKHLRSYWSLYGASFERQCLPWGCSLCRHREQCLPRADSVSEHGS